MALKKIFQTVAVIVFFLLCSQTAWGEEPGQDGKVKVRCLLRPGVDQSLAQDLHVWNQEFDLYLQVV